MSTDTKDPEFWKRKLMAFLHDPPCKAVDISKHEEIAWQFCKAAGMTDDDYETFKALKDTDHSASAADRFPFPKNRECSSEFTGQSGQTFIHPLGGDEFITDKNFEKEILKQTGEYESILQDAFGGIIKDDWKEKFFLYWRLWLENCMLHQNKYAHHLAIMPADTRIPDHTIWTHISLSSALQACRNPKTKELEPAFLIFQAGPVQDFIAQARSTRDLWSGSYMLSWLTAHAIKAITDKLGPDVIVFPALRGIGIFDALNREIYEKITYRRKIKNEEIEETLWQRLYHEDEEGKKAKKLLNPSLPNRFFAIVPLSRAEELANNAEYAFKKEFKSIADHTWDRFKKFAVETLRTNESTVEHWKMRWDKQVELFPQITWAYVPAEKNIQKVLDRVKELPICKKKSKKAKDEENNEKEQNIHTILSTLKNIAENKMGDDKDSRYYVNGKLINWAFAWGANYALAEYALAARRNTREFAQFRTDPNQDKTLKDVLSGKEEIIGNEAFWKKVKAIGAKEEEKQRNNKEGKNYPFFRENEGPYCAITIIKRFWCKGENNYLFEKLNIREKVFRQAISAESVEDIAKDKKEVWRYRDKKPDNPYVAVIAMDGDEMGKWISGEKAPKFLDQLSQDAREYFSKFEELKEIRRPLTPSYHLQFSEALSNFANYLAGKIVSHYNGQLIYAGGDDLLAMVPAKKAITCAQTLRAAFRGKKDELPEDENKYQFASISDGFINSDKDYPLIVPGPNADVSCGIAIAHYKYPLQKMVEEARKAESRAKKMYQRSAVSISLLKRGGEIIHWGTKWNSPALRLYVEYSEYRERRNPLISARFPYKLAELLAPYKLENNKFEDGFSPDKVIKTELDVVIKNQVSDKIKEKFKDLCAEYLKFIEKNKCKDYNDKEFTKWDDFVKLFLTAAFIERDRGE